MSRVKINSKQIFSDYEDSFSEEHDCEIIYLDDGFKILYDNCEVSFDGVKVFVKNSNMILEIEINKKTFAKMNTPYGKIELEVIGDNINYIKNPFEFSMRYFIKLGNTEKYINEFQILVLNK